MFGLNVCEQLNAIQRNGVYFVGETLNTTNVDLKMSIFLYLYILQKKKLFRHHVIIILIKNKIKK